MMISAPARIAGSVTGWAFTALPQHGIGQEGQARAAPRWGQAPELQQRAYSASGLRWKYN
ncbi:hypothetical protein BEN74_02015 [Acinetobacter sp. WCHAc010034]|uniref:hypothetical protein n=1 Tax=Acinetobacter sp. WCHAc010034 TaxID=1879049 RepID=UPI00083B1C71|nr:hypothetical protein [Acinetobacter sp. WCHAc010034]AYA01766.1 hypothetical protein BEN74_02015 [Acinetobacter sp. WCHAc010034]